MWNDKHAGTAPAESGAGKFSRRAMLRTSALAAVAAPLARAQRKRPTQRPNFVVILCDDMGFADLPMFGNPVIRTPNLDRMAREGTRLTSFCASPLCSPTRGMLLTGRYPVRTGLVNVTGPGSPVGLHPEDTTLAESLHTQGYKTAMFGKWHIGDFDTNAAFNPTRHGFEQFLGLPYSHDYNPPAGVPLYRNLDKVEQPVKFNLLTRRYTEAAVSFIKDAGHQPFFLYVAHNMPHIPIGTSDEFNGHSRAGRYGDVIEEIDWSVGRILEAVRDAGQDENTMVVFLSDNGPWTVMGTATYERAERGNKVTGDVGWSGLLRGSKGSTYEGGARVPCIFRWPGYIPADRVSAELASVMDIYGTVVPLAGGAVPQERSFDGINLSRFLFGGETSPRSELLYYSGSTAQALRQGAWKLRVAPEDTAMPVPASAPAPSRTVTQLFNLDTDPSERFDRSKEQPERTEKMTVRLRQLAAETAAGGSKTVAFRETVSPLD